MRENNEIFTWLFKLSVERKRLDKLNIIEVGTYSSTQSIFKIEVMRALVHIGSLKYEYDRRIDTYIRFGIKIKKIFHLQNIQGRHQQDVYIVIQRKVSTKFFCLELELMCLKCVPLKSKFNLSEHLCSQFYIKESQVKTFSLTTLFLFINTYFGGS